MTVLIAGISDDGEAFLAADSCMFDDRAYRALKTVRINDSCAVGCSESWAWGGVALARLFGRRDLEFRDPPVDVFQTIEDEHLTRPDLTCDSAIEEITDVVGWLNGLRKRAGVGKMQFNLAFSGVQNGVPCLASWKRDETNEQGGWTRQVLHGFHRDWQPMFIFGPEDLPDAYYKGLRERRDLCFYDRIRAVCDRYADLFSDKVDRDVWVRRASRQFIKEPLSGLVGGRK